MTAHRSEQHPGAAAVSDAIVEASQDPILTFAPSGEILTWNRAAERVFGYPAGDVIGRRGDLLGTAVPGEIGERSARGEFSAPFETIFWTRSGEPVPVSVALSAIRDSDGDVETIAAVVRDLSSTKNLEEQLRQAQKLEAVGSLAGGIAHDFNNLLTVIRTAAEIVGANVEGEIAREGIADIEASADLAAALTNQLLAFSRQQVLKPEPLDLNEVVAQTLDMLERLIGARIAIDRRLDPGLGAVYLDKSQIQQVTLNLCVNARDAMPEGGTLTVTTSNVVLDETYAATHLDAVPGRYALLEIADSGVGMDAETQRRAFEPFFSTKPAGSGLGLATVYGIVRQSGGQVLVYSEPGTGSSFKLYFPLTDAAGAPAALPPAPALEPAEGTETVLLVEDMPMLRDLASRILEQNGYRVLAAASGEEALDLAGDAEGIAAVVTDVVMPGIGGQELAAELFRRNPALGLVFTSGYPATTSMQEQVALGGVAFLQKPYGATDLISTIRAILAATR